VQTIRDWPETRAVLWDQLPDILTTDEWVEYLGEAPGNKDVAPERGNSVNLFLENEEKAREEIRRAIQRGEEAARNGRWAEAAEAYAEALQDRAFRWGVFVTESTAGCLALQMGISFVRAGDPASHERLCRTILAATPTFSDTRPAERFAKCCFLDGKSLPADLQRRGLELARFAAANLTIASPPQRAASGWVYHSAGIAEYWAGDLQTAVKLLTEAEEHPALGCGGGAKVFRAMALKRLGHQAEATALLGKAEDLFSEPLTDAAGNWWDLELCRIALEEARQLIGQTEVR
jgi:hypothetical protein